MGARTMKKEDRRSNTRQDRACKDRTRETDANTHGGTNAGNQTRNARKGGQQRKPDSTKTRKGEGRRTGHKEERKRKTLTTTQGSATGGRPNGEHASREFS